MAHKYSSFSSAFSSLQSHWTQGKDNFSLAVSEHTAALAAWTAGNDHEAIRLLCNTAYYDTYALRCIAQYDEAANDQSELMESLYWGGQVPPSYVLTMLKLIAVMSVAMPDEIMTFICLEDAYRAALWDRPYNPEYFATMVRAFKSWQ